MGNENDEITVQPEIQLLETVLSDIASGKLRVPKFQRSFVWRPEQMLDLFDSIERGYPIGSLLVWETTERLASLDEIGGLRVPSPKPNTTVSYLLDGHQRLSTLFGTLRRPADARRSANQHDWMWWVYRALRESDDRANRYRHWKSAESPPADYLPMRSILRTMDFLAFARDLGSRVEPSGNYDNLVSEAELVAQRVKSYKMAVVKLVGGSLKQAVEVFSRVNSSGQAMTPDQMVSALTYETTGPDSLADRIEAIRERIASTGFGDVSSTTIFRAILAVTGEEDVQDARWDALARRVEGDLLEAVEKTDKALGRAVEFLQRCVRVPLARLVPYNAQLMLLTAFFDLRPDPSEEQINDLTRWFWVTSWSGFFAGANTTQIKQALREMKKFAIGQGVLDLAEQRARPFPDRFDLRSARIRSFLIWELHAFPQRWSPGGNSLDAVELLAQADTAAYRHVSNQRGLESVSSPANRIVMRTGPGVSVKRALLEIPDEHLREALASHGIPQEAYDCLRRGDDSGFIDLRADELARREQKFIASYSDRYSIELVGVADIDTE
ncbi:DUF262 domain-containing protein [Streptomyces hilarionis]|uniref:DUF262 domain-containing protein n=1 Tax=Streptomyces hilarionis TaxID=2839954 RepID=UPI002119F422|nr:DUF262 domain-containing protein [Streptomyces hilarionis]MCQ9133062.1 DUF262 domain-containing protein [Streptomyces hilarionis]